MSDAGDGDGSAAGVAALVGRRCTTLRQVHGASVIREHRSGDRSGAAADGLVATDAEVALAIRTADCVPVVLAGDGGVAVVHAGWRSLAGGIVARACDLLRSTGVDPTWAFVGPHVCAGCYEFGADDLDRVSDVLGEAVRATSAAGTPALDLAGGVAAAIARTSVHVVDRDGRCTAHDPGLYSWRARGDVGRLVTAAWWEAA